MAASSGVDLAQALQSTLASQRATNQELRNLTTQMQTSHEMLGRFLGSGGNAQQEEQAASALRAQAAGPSTAAPRVSAPQVAASASSVMPQEPSTESGGGSGGGMGGGGGVGAPSGPDQPSIGPTSGAQSLGGATVGSGAPQNGLPFLGPLQGMISHVPVVGGLISAGIGAAFSPISKGIGEFQHQRDLNDVYRSMEGGTQWGALGERAQEEGYRFSTLGLLSGQEAAQAFQGVTAMGYTEANKNGGASRSDALQFVGTNKSVMGESVGESLDQLSQSSNNALINLKDLSTALQDVSSSASKAGVNTQMARAQMMQLQQAATNAGMGQNATGWAAAQQTVNNNMGRTYAQTTNSTGTNSYAMQVVAASNAGINVNKLQYYASSDPAKYNQIMGQFNQQIIKGHVDQALVDWIKQYHSAHPKATLQDVGSAFYNYFKDVNQDGKYGTNNSWALMIEALSMESWEGDILWHACMWVVQQVLGDTVSAVSKKQKISGKKTSQQTLQHAGLTGSGGQSGWQGNTTTQKQLSKNDRGGLITSTGSASGTKPTAVGKWIKGAASDVGNAIGSAWNDIFGGGPDDWKHKQSGSHKAPAKHPAASSSGSSHTVRIDVSPEAKKLIKAIVVTGNDPYSGANSASSGTPHPLSQSTR